MKYFAIASLLVAGLLVAADLLAAETIPWHWDDEDSVNVAQQQTEETNMQQEESAEWDSDLGW